MAITLETKMTQYLEQLYSKHAYNYVLDGEPSLDPEDYRKKTTLERDVDNAKDYLKQVLYWLYEAPNFDEIAFERPGRNYLCLQATLANAA